MKKLKWLATLALSSLAAGPLAAEKPNILFIIADDLGWNDVGYHGSEIQTPNLDRLAKQGVRLDRHYVNPMCSATRSALQSGRFASRFGVLGATNDRVYPPGMTTLASALKRQGYFTAITGKWHLGSKPEWGPNHYGFDASHGSLAGGIDQYGHFYKDGPFRKTWHRNHKFIEQEGHATDLFTEEAIGWITQRRDEPWFIQVALTAVHIPLQEPRSWMKLYDGKISDPSRKLYAACASHMDDAIGRIVRAVDDSGQRNRTLIVFTSDNGGSKSWTGTQQYGGGHIPCPVLGDNQPLRGWKGQLYEGGVRVPAFVNWPGRLKPRVVTDPIHIVDWMPTLCNLTGFKPDEDLRWDGRDMWRALNGGPPSKGLRTLYWKANSASSVLSANMKLLLHRKTGKVELYNLKLDPSETNDLAKQEPAMADRLRSTLENLARDDKP